jgi:hypothetical protein
MLYESPIQELNAPDAPSADAGNAAPASPHLPTGLVMLERATAALRAALRARGLDHYTIFHAAELDLDDIDLYLPRLETAQALWQPLPLLPAGDQPHALETDDNAARLEGVGLLHLPRFDFVLARWHWISVKYNARETTLLAAAPDRHAYARLHRALVDLRRGSKDPVWEVIRSVHQRENLPRKYANWDDIFLPPSLVARLRSEIVGFFDAPVVELYRSMNVPHRRGVLMPGPPGNGKTSVIRAIGAALPHCVAMILRPTRSLDDDDLKTIFRRWRKHAPALLIIEDLDHLLKDYINLSHFLNHLDGIDETLAGGLLLLATTNHPEKLDPALNNRPGRFDVVIELPTPDHALRHQFFQTHLAKPGSPPIDPDTVETLARETRGLSFAHLHEIIRLAGLLAIHDQSATRTPGHLITAANLVIQSNATARNGFPTPPEAPFGLAQFRRKSSA